MMNSPEILKTHYKNCFLKYGDNHLGADWPKEKDLCTRYDVMLSIVKDINQKNKILDFGCGTGMLYNHILSKNMTQIEYHGIDINDVLIEKAKSKYKDTSFLVADINQDSSILSDYDYVICNGIFTEKLQLSHKTMFDFFSNTIKVLFKKTKKGIAFNLMTIHLDYERDDLFHVSHDELANFLTKNLSRNYVIRNDYGLYEYTTYLYK